jgi:hypothetical protein
MEIQQNSIKDQAVIDRLVDPRYKAGRRKLPILSIGHVTETGNEIVGYALGNKNCLIYVVKKSCCGSLIKTEVGKIDRKCNKCSGYARRNVKLNKSLLKIYDVCGSLKIISDFNNKPSSALCECLSCGFIKEYLKYVLQKLSNTSTGGCCRCSRAKIKLSKTDLRFLGQNKQVRLSSFNWRKKNAEKRKLSFELSLQEFTNLTTDPCYLCDNKTTSLESLDRIDSSKG